jgi:hypothetical protein
MLGSGSYPRQNGRSPCVSWTHRAHAVHLDWLQSVELRRRVHAGLNKGEARNALARAVFFNRLGNPATAASSSSATGPVKPSMTACCSTCRRSAGSTST